MLINNTEAVFTHTEMGARKDECTAVGNTDTEYNSEYYYAGISKLKRIWQKKRRYPLTTFKLFNYVII